MIPDGLCDIVREERFYCELTFYFQAFLSKRLIHKITQNTQNTQKYTKKIMWESIILCLLLSESTWLRVVLV